MKGGGISREREEGGGERERERDIDKQTMGKRDKQ